MTTGIVRVVTNGEFILASVDQGDVTAVVQVEATDVNREELDESLRSIAGVVSRYAEHAVDVSVDIPACRNARTDGGDR
ncbi:MAG: hypothetical protein ACQETI_14710 [Halobacteriota archaeon]